MSGPALVGGYAADVVFGDPRRWHPVAGFGQVALAVERAMYKPTRLRGALFAGALVAAAGVAGELLARAAARAGAGRGVALAAVTWAALGGRSLTGEAHRLATCVELGDLDGARTTLPSLCGRDPAGLDAPQLCRAAVESVAENTGDAVVGALVWGAIAGPAGVAAYRAANTLDAMVGHRSERYESFGWAAARLDDVMSWPGARAAAALTTLCAPVVGGTRRGTWHTVRADGAAHPSPNAGSIEAAFAGALGVRLGGLLTYGGVAELRPKLGADGREPGSLDVHRATRLSWAVGASAAGTCALARALHTRGRARRSAVALLAGWARCTTGAGGDPPRAVAFLAGWARGSTGAGGDPPPAGGRDGSGRERGPRRAATGPFALRRAASNTHGSSAAAASGAGTRKGLT